jgi:Nucleotidyl transferase AbiEii toxin, Type IV TA system
VIEVVDFSRLLAALSGAAARFIVVGGTAALAHGSARLTQDIDVVYDRAGENLERIVRALAPFDPYPRGAPPGLPFQWDARTLENGCNFTLRTTAGPIDLLGEITGGGAYDALLPHSVELELFGYSVRCIALEKLIETKRAAGRPKDFEAIAELEALLEERDDSG